MCQCNNNNTNRKDNNNNNTQNNTIKVGRLNGKIGYLVKIIQWGNTGKIGQSVYPVQSYEIGHGSSRSCYPSLHMKIHGIYGCLSPNMGFKSNRR